VPLLLLFRVVSCIADVPLILLLRVVSIDASVSCEVPVSASANGPTPDSSLPPLGPSKSEEGSSLSEPLAPDIDDVGL